MATAGLSLADQFSTERFLGQPPDPFGPTPMASSGLGGLGTSTADMAVLGEALSRGSQFTPPQMRQAPTIAFSPSSNKVFVQGTVFDADDAAQALQSEQLLSAPGTGLPSAGDWVPLDAQAYGQYLESIRNPGLWRLAKKNFGRGVDVMQMLAGRGMQLAGAEQTGGRIVEAQMEDLRKTAPFERMFTDIESGRGAVEWLVANLAQQGPNLLESVATALAGFAAGSAVGTPLAGPGAALAALAGKSAFKQSVLAAAKKKAAGETLDAAENKLLREAAGLAGATAASYAQNLATGAADIYGELREQGAGVEDIDARLKALAGSIPYAALETLPEFGVAALALRGGTRAAMPAGASMRARGVELLKRGAIGGAIGGTLEGTTEAGQEALLLGLSGQDLTSSEGMNRLINSFAAGFGVGGPIGAIANLRGNKPANLLDAGKTTEPAAPTLPANAPPGTQGELFPIAPGEMAGPAFSVLPEPPAAPPMPQPGQMALFEPSAPSVADRLRRGIMPPGPGAQGQLGLVGGQVAPGYVPPPVLAPEVPAAPGLTPEEAAAQGALQFAPEAPAPTGNLGNALQQAIQRQQMARMQQQREAELAAQREAELERLAGVAGRQRQLDLIEPERPALPMVPAEARPPRQLPLFPRGALPGPTRRQRAAVATPLAQVPPGARRLRRQRAQAPQEQLRLPYIATDVTPEIARATWNDKRPASVRKWEALSEEAQQKWTDAIIAAKATPALRAQISREETQARLKPKEKPSAAQEGKLKQGRVAERAQGDAGVGARGDAGQKPTAQVPAGGAQAGGRGVTLKRGKKAPVVDITQRRAEQIEEEDARREAEEDRAAREKIQAGLKERHTKRLQELMRAIRDGRKVLSDTKSPGSLEAKDLQRLLDTFQDYIDRFNRLVSPDNTDDIQQTQADVFDRLMTVDLPRELRAAEFLSGELTKPKKEPPGPKAEAARAAAPDYLAPGEFVYHAVRNDKDIQDILDNGLRVGANVSFDTSGQAFSGEGDTILVFRRGDVSSRGKGYQNDGVTTKAATPVAILKDTSLEADRPTRGELEEQGTAAYEEEQRLAEYAKREYGLTDEDILQYSSGARKIKDAPAEAQPILKRILAQSKLSARLLDQADTAPETVATAAQVLGRYSRYNLPVQEVRIEVTDDTQTVTATDTKPEAAPARAAAPEAAPAPTPSTATVETETVTALDAEQQWNEERLPGDVAYADLPQAAKDRWAASDRSGAIQITILQELSDRLIRMTNTERLNYAIATASAAMDANNIDQFDEVIDTIVEVAYFKPDGFSKDQQTEARNFLSDPDVFTNAQNASIQDSFVMNAEGRSLEATTKVTKTGTGTSGALKPWFEFAQSIPGMVQRLAEVRVVFLTLPRDLAETLLKNGSIGRENLPDTIANEILGKVVTKKKSSEGDPQRSPLTELLELITKTNNTDAPLTKAQRESRNAKLQALFSAANAASLDTAQAGPYFNADGTPRTANIDGKFRVLTKEEFANRDAIEQAAREQRKANDAAKKAPTLSTFDDWEEDGRFFRDDGTPLRAPLSIGRVRLAVANFLSKIFVKPTVHIYRDQADLKARNPQLHARASASRPQGDFDATPAVAYSFGKNEVIVFTDRVRTEQQLRFVLAHETLGHVGLRGIIPAKDFDKLMVEIYDQSPNVRLAVDAAMEARELPKAEAVEEYLADFAASLDVSYIARIWNAIKNALNKLGVQFGDEAARYWVSQARRYVRTGQASTFTVQDVFSRMQEVESGQDPENTGRFSRAGDLRMDNVNAENLMRDNIGGLPDSFEDAFRKIRGVAGNTFESADKFLAQVFSLMNFRARENAGAYEVDRTLRQGRGIAMQVRNALNEKLGPLLSRAVEIPGAPWKFGGITADQYDQVNRILYAAQRLKFSQLPSTAELGRTPLYTVDQTTGELVPNAQEIERLYNMGLLKLEQMRDGFTYQDKFMREGKEVTETVRVAGIPGLTADSTEWKAYIAAREAMRDVELQLLTSRYLSFTQEKGLSFREIASVTRTGTLLPNEKAFFERMYRQYKKLYIADPVVDPDDGRTTLNLDSITKANDFLVAFNRALIATEKASSGDAVAIERNAKLAEFFTAAEVDDVILNIEEFKDRFVRTEETQFLVQNRMKDLVVAEISNDGADVATRRNLAGGYVPVLRRGSFQIRVQAVANGKAVRLKQDYKDQLIYSQFDSRDEAVEMAALINRKLFSEDDTRKTYKVEAYNEDTMQYELMDVQLQAMPGNALDGIAAPPQLNLNEFVRGLRQFSITLPPKKLEEVVVALTAQNDRARQRLERNFVPGADPDAGRAIAEHIEARASTIAKIMMRPRLAELTNMRMGTTRALWMGDENRLNTLKQTWEATSKDPAATPEQKLAAKRDYDFYAFQYEKTNPKVKGTRVEKGNQYFNEAAQALHFLENNRNITEGDFASGNVASRIRAATSYLQLGGSIATGALNYIGSLTNVIPYMATYNQSTAFGAGFGFGPSFAAFSRALNQVGLRKAVTLRVGDADMDLNTAEFYDKVAEDTNLQRRIGITEDEARFLAGEIRDGEMVPALANATTNTARGRVSSGAAQKFLDGWMWTFNSTEQAVRRATGLSVYRLEKQRSLAAGLSEKTARGLAREAAVNALRFTLGDYSVMNRPPLWRNGVLSFVYIYKTFPTMSIQLFRRLPRSGQIYMLAALWMLGGLAALPFAEDIEDLIDTIAQGLGFTKTSIRYEIAKVVDGIAPGMSPYFLRGFVNAYFPGNVADRVSLGNFIPGTGVLLAGANISRELTDLAGPAVSMLIGVGQSAVDIARLGSDRVTLVDVLRESPATLGRAMGDAVAYMQSGAIVDRRGYVVTPDVSAATVAVRMLGFYPSEATQQYDVIRVAKRMTDYQKEVVAGFRHAYIKAKLQGDNEQAAQIVAAVDAWNESAKGTATEIRNFTTNANKALREASRPAGERFLKSAPRAAREDIETVADLLGY